MYVLDAGVLIWVVKHCFPIEDNQIFWQWLISCANDGKLKMPRAIYRELKPRNESFRNWVGSPKVRRALILREEIKDETVRQIIDQGYAPDLDQDEHEEMGNDPMLIAAAFQDRASRVVVTREKSNPDLTRGKTKVPDACLKVSVRCTNQSQKIISKNPLTLLEPNGLPLWGEADLDVV